jgi:hypothetical protein
LAQSFPLEKTITWKTFSGHFAGAFGREGAQPPPDLSPFRTGLFPVFTLLPVREGAGGEKRLPHSQSVKQDAKKLPKLKIMLRGIFVL